MTLLALLFTMSVQAPAPMDAGPESVRASMEALDAAPPAPMDAADAATELDVGWTLVRTLVALGMVVALAYLTLNVGLRRLLGLKGLGGARIVTVLERVALDPKRALFVVEAAGEVLLVGGGDGGLTLLTKLDAASVRRLREPGGRSLPGSPDQGGTGT